MKRVALILLAAAWLAAPLPVAAQQTQPFTGTEHVESFDVTMRIASDGTIAVNERITYDFDGVERHGIYRNVPYVTVNDAGKRFVMGFDHVSVTDDAGNAYPLVQSREDDDIRWKIGDPDWTVTGKHVYDIGYTVSGALTYFSGHDELYWNAVGSRWQVPVTHATVTVTLPSDVATENLHAACFTGAQGSSDAECTAVVKDARTILIATEQPLGMYEGLTVVVGFPKGMVAVLEPQEMVPFFDTLMGKVVLALLGIGAALWYIVAPIWVIRKWWREGRDPRPAMGEARSWFSPPKNQHHRALTPAETGTLIDERADLRDIYASVVDLARRGYLTIIETKKNQFDLDKKKDWTGDPTVQPFERELLNGIFKEKGRVSIKSLDLTQTLTKVKSLLYETLVADKFFPSNPHALRGWYIALAVISFIIFNPILFLIALIFGQNMPRKTLFGAGQAAIARSLRNFLTSQDKKLAFQAKNQMMFESLLPYAVAFGVERIWAERFKGIGLKNPDWYQSSTGGRFNSVVFASSLGRGMSASFAVSIASHSSTGHSSGFSGGFSGGGGGGGGGGSW